MREAPAFVLTLGTVRPVPAFHSAGTYLDVDQPIYGALTQYMCPTSAGEQ